MFLRLPCSYVCVCVCMQVQQQACALRQPSVAWEFWLNGGVNAMEFNAAAAAKAVLELPEAEEPHPIGVWVAAHDFQVHALCMHCAWAFWVWNVWRGVVGIKGGVEYACYATHAATHAAILQPHMPLAHANRPMRSSTGLCFPPTSRQVWYWTGAPAPCRLCCLSPAPSLPPSPATSPPSSANLGSRGVLPVPLWRSLLPARLLRSVQGCLPLAAPPMGATPRSPCQHSVGPAPRLRWWA